MWWKTLSDLLYCIWHLWLCTYESTVLRYDYMTPRRLKNTMNTRVQSNSSLHTHSTVTVHKIHTKRFPTSTLFFWTGRHLYFGILVSHVTQTFPSCWLMSHLFTPNNPPLEIAQIPRSNKSDLVKIFDTIVTPLFSKQSILQNVLMPQPLTPPSIVSRTMSSHGHIIRIFWSFV